MDNSVLLIMLIIIIIFKLQLIHSHNVQYHNKTIWICGFVVSDSKKG